MLRARCHHVQALVDAVRFEALRLRRFTEAMQVDVKGQPVQQHVAAVVQHASADAEIALSAADSAAALAAAASCSGSTATAPADAVGQQ